MTTTANNNTNATANESNVIFEQWVSHCLDEKIPTSFLPSALRNAQSAAKDHFENLLNRGTSISTTSTAKQLAQLISKLGPAISLQSSTSTSTSTKMSVRALALNYLLGALQALDQKGASLPFKMMELVSNFLLEHCGPIRMQLASMSQISSKDDDQNDDQDLPSDDVRDYAFKCINTLLKIAIDAGGANNDDADADADGDGDADGENNNTAAVSVDVDQCIKFRTGVALKAIQKRCTTLEECDEQDSDDDYSMDGDDDDNDEGGLDRGKEEAKILSNLSLLPRAKRSLCFQSLQSATLSMEKDARLALTTGGGSESVCTRTDLVVNFASFAAACLHGETDPRCLMQMLHLMTQLQTSLAPIVESSAAAGNGNGQNNKNFPFTDIFDSAAVYYPVRFTPPPNDPHGITRDGINAALMEVLTCSSRFNHDNMVSDSVNMTVLATGLFLERISPPNPSDAYGGHEDEDAQDVSTVQDRIESLGDLESLLLVPLDNDGDGDEKEQQRILSNLTLEIVKEMSDVLYRCHEESAATVATGKSEDEIRENKVLADMCRRFVTRIAYEFERQQLLCNDSGDSVWNSFKKAYNGSGSLWDTFVKDRVETLVDIISSSPQSLKGRMAIAYLASLSACGGEKTLRLCVDASIPRMATLLDDHLKTSDDNRDNEKISTVVYGISVLFSSCRLSIEQITKDGINIHPHPLQPYGSRIIQTLCKIINDKIIKDTEDRRSNLEIAAIKALESVLLSSPAAILNISEGKDTDVIRETVLSLAKMLVANIFSGGKEDATWKLACARIVGSTIGKAIKGRKDENDFNQPDVTVLDSDPDIVSFVETTLFPKIIESSITTSNTAQSERYDWMVLAYACETDQNYAVVDIVSELYRTLVGCLKESTKTDVFLQAETIARAISYILKNGGPNTYSAFHSMPQDDQLENDLIQLLTTNRTDQNDDNEMERISILLLPGTRDQYRSEADRAVKLSHTILPHILPVYCKDFPVKKIEGLILRASQVLPPLSDWDGAELCTIIPVLSVALSGDITLRSEILGTLVGIASYLADYALDRQVIEASRSAAASCLFSIIGKYQVNMKECIGLNILKNQIGPVVSNAIEDRSPDSSYENMSSLEEAMGLLGLVASAASQRGRASASTTDEVARFLVLISCEGAASAPNIGITNPLDCSEHALGQDQFEISSIAASALGSIFSVAPHVNPFAKQRLAHLVIPIVLSYSHPSIADMNGAELGCLMCASHVVCCISEKAVGQQNLEKLTSIIVGGLEKAVQILCTDNKTSPMPPMILQDLLYLLLVSLLKLHNQCPSMTIPHLGTIVPALLLITITFDGASLNLISMQMLVDLTDSVDDGVVHFCKTYKPTVLKHLATSLDHPSSQVRQATVQARNIWSVIE